MALSAQDLLGIIVTLEHSGISETKGVQCWGAMGSHCILPFFSLGLGVPRLWRLWLDAIEKDRESTRLLLLLREWGCRSAWD